MTTDLAEQYLYWAGKPKCQTSPGNEIGSSIREAFNFSQKIEYLFCAYQTKSQAEKETQIPLNPGCSQGKARVVAFEEVRTLSDVVEKLKMDIPVVVGAKLCEKKLYNSGPVSLKESKKSLRKHSKSHAFQLWGFWNCLKS